jgi:NADH:ubiquinone oxidoreductase subunit 6 (subunit J)
MIPVETVVFGLVAFACLVLAILAISVRSAVRAAFCFGATTLCIAGLLLLLGAPLLGASEILIGASGSALLCLVVGVATNFKPPSSAKRVRVRTVVAVALCAALFSLLCLILPSGRPIAQVEHAGSIAGLLVGDFLLPLFLAGFAFVVVAVGTAVLTNPDSAAGAASGVDAS